MIAASSWAAKIRWGLLQKSENKEEIKQVNDRVDEVTANIANIKQRMDDLENKNSPSKLYSDAVKTVDGNITKLR